MDHYRIYHKEIPDFITEITKTMPMRRLKNIGMNCGCEYTSFPRFFHLQPYSRYDHSIGAALIVWHFTKDIRQSVAALLHDIASPVFAHVVDFLKGDYLTQEATESGTKEIIENSEEIQTILKRYRLNTDDVCDYHLYPVADNDAPKLSADRMEYSFGNLINYGFLSKEDLKKIYDDLVVDLNKEGETEIVFQSEEYAHLFAVNTLECSKIYVSDEDRWAMQRLAEILRYALDKGIISEDDLYSTEPEVIGKLKSDIETKQMWNRFCLSDTILKSEEEREGYRKIFAKKRFIDPFIKDKGRLSGLSEDFNNKLETFKNSSQDYWVKGIINTDRQDLF